MLSKRVIGSFIQVARSRSLTVTPCCALQQKDVTQDKAFEKLGKDGMQAKQQEEHSEGMLKRAMDKMSNMSHKARDEYDPNHPITSTVKAATHTVKDVAQEAKETVKSAFESVKDMAGGAVGTAKDKMGSAMHSASESVKSGAQKVKEMTTDTTSNQSSLSKDSTYAAPGSADYDPAEDSDRYDKQWATSMKEDVKRTNKSMGQGLKDSMKDAKDTTMDKMHNMKEKVKDAADDMKEGMKDKWDSAKDYAKEMKDQTMEKAQDMKETMNDKWDNTKDAASQSKDKVTEKLNQVRDKGADKIHETMKRGDDVSHRVKDMYTGTEEDSKGGSGFNRITPDAAEDMLGRKPKGQGTSNEGEGSWKMEQTLLDDIYEHAPPQKAVDDAVDAGRVHSKTTEKELEHMVKRMDSESGKEGSPPAR